MRERVAILGECLVQVGEIYTHSPLAICFFDHDYIGQPLRVVDFPNEICFQQFAHLFNYDFVSFLGEDFFLLSDQRERQVYIEPVDHGIRTNPWHVLMTPNKDVPIVLQEKGKIFANRRVSLHANTSDSALNVIVQGNLFKVFRWLYCNHPFFKVQSLQVIIHFQHGNVAFTSGHLVPSCFSYPILCWELYE